jgi:hypothetical protein
MAVRDAASRKRRIIAGCFAAQADKSIQHPGRMERARPERKNNSTFDALQSML